MESKEEKRWGASQAKGMEVNGVNSLSETTPLLESSIAKDHDSSINPATSSYSSGGLEPTAVRVYWWRWVVLFVFVLDLGANNGLWITFSPIEDVISCYYKVSNFWVNSLSMVSMLTYVLFLVPSAWCLTRLGLRTTVVMGTCLTAIGAGVRLAGTGSQYFWVLLAGQTISSFCNCLIWGAPSLVSVIWFPPSERATATALAGAVSPQLGILAGFALSPLLVHSPDTNAVCGGDTHGLNVTTSNGTSPVGSAQNYEEWSDTIFWQLFWYMLGQAIVAMVMVIATLFAFPEAPPTPPSLSRQLEVEGSASGVVDVATLRYSVVKVMKNGYFLLFIITAGINVGAAGAIVSLLNEVVHPYFPGNDKEVAYLGIITIAASFVAMIAVGRVLDWTNAYYALNVSVYVAAAVCMAAFSVSLQFQSHFWVLYITVGALGATIQSFQAICYEYAAEMTYPLPEGTSAGLLNMSSQVVSIVMIVVVGQVAKSTRTIPIGTWFITGLTALGALISVFIMPELRRLKLDVVRKRKRKSVSRKSLSIQDNSTSED